jgi:hypothetical protein
MRIAFGIGAAFLLATLPATAETTSYLQPLTVKEFLSLPNDLQIVYVGGIMEGMSFVQYGYTIPNADKWIECARLKTLGDTTAEVISMVKAPDFHEGVSSALAQTMGHRCKH